MSIVLLGLIDNMDIKKKLDLLTKALEREKAARQLLEKKLDEQNKVKFEVNQELLKSYENARIREVQLQFLSFLSSNNIDDKNFTEMLQYFAQNIALLLDNAPVCIIMRQNHEVTKVWCKPKQKNAWVTLSNKFEDINFAFVTTQWSKVGTKVPQINEILENEYLIAIDFPYSVNSDVIIILGGSHFCYSDDLKQTLDIAAKQFSSILDKRLTDVELSINFKKLKKTMSVLKSTQNQLIHSEKMASLGTLAAGVAHEINNPLSFLTSNLETLNEYIQVLMTNNINQLSECKNLENKSDLTAVLEDLPDLQRACLDATKRIAEIVNSLRSFSRKEEKDKHLINIEEPINAALEIIKNELKHKFKIKKHIIADLPNIWANFGQLQQVFVNLLMNAVHAMPNGGLITITTKVTNDSLVLIFEDEGCGIQKKLIKRLFEPFYTTKKVNEGTGLGLSVSYAIINNHNANIKVESKVDKGSKFIISFPLS
ncbi:MAG: hypothetical protein KC484_01885 [Colwelliaceae bacterium]|nr:hypothetical protein [Colwelliaceae bacterium]